jgi:hypothetical protein
VSAYATTRVMKAVIKGGKGREREREGEGRGLRLRRIRIQIHLLDRQDIVLGVAAEVQRVVAGNLVLFLDRDLVGAHPRSRRGRGNR